MSENFEKAIVLFKTKVGKVEIAVEVASTPEKIAKGFMDRIWFPYGTGMLFKFDKPTKQSFWMLNTRIPLSIAFFDEQGKIIDIQNMEPNSLDAHTPPSNYIGAIEVEQGFFDNLNVEVGDFVEVNEDNHPLILNESVGYINAAARATHEGLKIDSEIIAWPEVDRSEIVFKYPRFLNTNNIEKKVGNFKSVQYINQSNTIRKTTAREVPESYAAKFASGDDAQKSWENISGKAREKYGIDFDRAVDHVVRAVAQFHADSTPEEYDSALRFWSDHASTPMRVGESLGFPRHSLAAALSHLSPQTPWHTTNTHLSQSPHNGNIDQFYHALSLVNEAKTTGLKVDSERLSRIQANAPKFQARIDSTQSFPTNFKVRGETHVNSEDAGSSRRQLIVPQTTGTYSIDELSDSAIASLLTAGQNKVDERLKAVKFLTSSVRKGQTPFRTEHLLSKDYKRGKVSSMTDNVEFPETSTRTTNDMWQDILIPSSTNADFEKMEDLNVTSAEGRGAPAGSKWKDKSIKPDESLEAFDHQTPVRSLGKSAGYYFKDAILQEAHKKLLGLGLVPQGSRGLVTQSGSWNAVRTNPLLQNGKMKTDKIKPEDVKEELRTPSTQLWLPANVRDALSKPVTSDSHPACKEIHPMIERARSLRAADTSQRQIFVPQI